MMTHRLSSYFLSAVFVVMAFYGCDSAIPRYSAHVVNTVPRRAPVVGTLTDIPHDPDSLTMQEMKTDMPSMILKRTGYIVSYNRETKLPNWVAWRITAKGLQGRSSRKGIDFMEDESVPSPRAEDMDYYNSGYDRGHICPAADNKWSSEAMRQSFLFTNICPQDPSLNRGDWNELEQTCRKWAQRYGEVYVVAGPVLYNRKHRTIGKHRVVVPEAFFKVVLCLKDDPKAIGFIYKNVSANRPMGDYINTVDQVERITGIDFFPSLPDSIEDIVESEADLDRW